LWVQYDRQWESDPGYVFFDFNHSEGELRQLPLSQLAALSVMRLLVARIACWWCATDRHSCGASQHV
jgi:hypothetical protein